MTLEVRAARAADAPAVADLYRPWVTGSVASFEVEPPDTAEVERRMLQEPRLPWLLAVRDGEPVGYAYASAHHSRPAYRWAAECSVYLAAPERGRGTGGALYAQLFPLLRDLGLLTVLAGITLPNPASTRLHESFGFVLVARYERVGFKAGAWHDVGWWQLSLAERPASPAEPRAWSPA